MATTYRGTVKEKRALNLFIEFMRASQTVISRHGKILKGYDLTSGQFGTLESLYHLGPMCQKSIAEKLLITEGNITLIINNLEKTELVRRIRDERDRRYFIVHLSEKGKKLIRKIFPEHVSKIVEQMTVLSNLEQEQLTVLCRKLRLDPRES